jgi:hypothetical protein
LPRKILGVKKERVISTKITAEKFNFLLETAREFYIKQTIAQPNLAQLLQYIIDDWLRKLPERKFDSKSRAEGFMVNEDFGEPTSN